MPIRREEMQEIVKRYKEPIGLNLGSHSALDAWQGQRNYGLRSIIYTTPGRARIYLKILWLVSQMKLLRICLVL